MGQTPETASNKRGHIASTGRSTPGSDPSLELLVMSVVGGALLHGSAPKIIGGTGFNEASMAGLEFLVSLTGFGSPPDLEALQRRPSTIVLGNGLSGERTVARGRRSEPDQLPLRRRGTQPRRG